MLDQLSVAEAAALINVGIIFLTLSFPLLVSLVTVGISKKNINAATWSVLGRLLNQSLWPNILRTDTASSIKVDKGVTSLSNLSTLAAVILAFASALTPLGLSEVQALRNSEDTQFAYVRDTSPIGLATQSRDSYTFNRVCGEWTSCPGNPHDPLFSVQNGSDPYLHTGPQFRNGTPKGTVSTAIAANITHVFSSATSDFPSTVAGAFDIEYRSFVNYNNDSYRFSNWTMTGWRDHGNPRTQGQFRFVQEFIGDATIQAVEGLIVSTTEKPGIGFRNHTLPPNSQIGYAWQEDILWLEPETSCTNLNVSFDYVIPIPGGWEMKGWFVDRGGFSSVPAVSGVSWYSPNDDLDKHTQHNPNLLARSHVAATATNYVILRMLNQTAAEWSTSEYGQAYDIADDLFLASADDIDPRQLSFSDFGAGYGPAGKNGDSYWDPGLPGILIDLDSPYDVDYDINAQLGVNDVLSWSYDISKIHQAGLAGGILMGAGIPLDQNDMPMAHPPDFNADVGEKWSRPLYSCVSAVKASIKTIDFVLNGTASLSNLVIQSVRPSNGVTPTWAVEHIPISTEEYYWTDEVVPMRTGSPFWGIVSPEMAERPGISTLKRAELYIPVGMSTLSIAETLSAQDGAASANVPLQFLTQIYSPVSAYSDSDTAEALQLLSGRGNQALVEKWTQLSKDALSAGRIIDLIWTDLTANALVGTKSVLSRPSGEKSVASAEMPAQEYVLRLTFDWRFAAVVLIFVALYLAILCWSVILLFTRRVTIAALELMLNQSAAGRSVTTERHLGRDETNFEKTSVWAETHGDELVLSNAPSLMAAKGNGSTTSMSEAVQSEQKRVSLTERR